MITFVKNELRIFQRVLRPDYNEDSKVPEKREDLEDAEEEEEEQRRSSREALLKITLHLLKRMKQEELADTLQSSESFNTQMVANRLYSGTWDFLTCCFRIKDFKKQ